MKNFLISLLSDSNVVSSKRFIGVIALVMLVAYGVAGIVQKKEVEFWIVYVTVMSVTVWIAFRFMSSDKALKYNIIGQLTSIGKISDSTVSKSLDEIINNEQEIDKVIQPTDKLEG